MSLKRRAIRQAIVALLKGNTGAGARVTSNRNEVPQWATELPAIVVYTRRDPARLLNVSPPTYVRAAEIVVECHLDTANEGLPADDDIDELAEQVEGLVNPRLGAFAQAFQLFLPETVYNGAEAFTQTLEGEVPLAGVRMTWTFAYVQEIDEVDLADCQPWLRTDVDWDFGTIDSPEAEDAITMP